MTTRVSMRAALGLTALVTLLVITFSATAADAHEPVFVTAADLTPEAGPLLEDGNHSWAVYGVLTEPGATRGVRTQLVAGQPLVVDLLIPALSPEQDLAPDDLPRVTVEWPDGTRRTLESDLRVRFDEPFSTTSYVRIAELREPAGQSGVYGLTVTGPVPARFSLATGRVEGFGGAQRDAEPAPAGGLTAWYATPPPTAAAPTSTSTTSNPSGPIYDRVEQGDGDANTAITVGVVAVGVAAVAVAVVVRRRRRRPTA